MTTSDTDRFIKIKLRDALLPMVYELWERRLTLRMDELITTNAQLNPSPDSYYLRLRGVCYAHSSIPNSPADFYPSSRLHPHLKDVAHTWVEENNEVMEEKRMVSHSLSAILASSWRIEDYLEVIPASLHELTKSFQPLLPDPALHKRAQPSVVQQLQFIHRPYLALMGQRYVMSLIF